MQLREGNFSLSERHAHSPRASKDEAHRVEIERRNALDGGTNFGIVNSTTAAISGTKAHETRGLNCPSERTSTKRSSKPKVVSHSNGIEQHKYQKSRTTVAKEQLSSDAELKTQTGKESGRLTYSSPSQTPFGLPFTAVFSMQELLLRRTTSLYRKVTESQIWI